MPSFSSFLSLSSGCLSHNPIYLARLLRPRARLTLTSTQQDLKRGNSRSALRVEKRAAGQRL